MVANSGMEWIKLTSTTANKNASPIGGTGMKPLPQNPSLPFANFLENKLGLPTPVKLKSPEETAGTNLTGEKDPSHPDLSQMVQGLNVPFLPPSSLLAIQDGFTPGPESAQLELDFGLQQLSAKGQEATANPVAAFEMSKEARPKNWGKSENLEGKAEIPATRDHSQKKAIDLAAEQLAFANASFHGGVDQLFSAMVKNATGMASDTSSPLYLSPSEITNLAISARNATPENGISIMGEIAEIKVIIRKILSQMLPDGKALPGKVETQGENTKMANPSALNGEQKPVKITPILLGLAETAQMQNVRLLPAIKIEDNKDIYTFVPREEENRLANVKLIGLPIQEKQLAHFYPVISEEAGAGDEPVTRLRSINELAKKFNFKILKIKSEKLTNEEGHNFYKGQVQSLSSQDFSAWKSEFDRLASMTKQWRRLLVQTMEKANLIDANLPENKESQNFTLKNDFKEGAKIEAKTGDEKNDHSKSGIQNTTRLRGHSPAAAAAKTVLTGNNPARESIVMNENVNLPENKAFQNLAAKDDLKQGAKIEAKPGDEKKDNSKSGIQNTTRLRGHSPAAAAKTAISGNNIASESGQNFTDDSPAKSTSGKKGGAQNFGTKSGHLPSLKKSTTNMPEKGSVPETVDKNVSEQQNLSASLEKRHASGKVVNSKSSITRSPLNQARWVNQKGWKQYFMNIRNQIRSQIRPNMSEMQIRLKPESLGQMRLAVTMSDGRMNASFLVESFKVKKLLESGIDSLRQTLHDKGIRADIIEIRVAPALAQAAKSETHHQGFLKDSAQQKEHGNKQPAQHNQQEKKERDEGFDRYL